MRNKGWQSGSRKVKHQGSMNRPKCVSKKTVPHTADLQYDLVGRGSYRCGNTAPKVVILN